MDSILVPSKKILRLFREKAQLHYGAKTKLTSGVAKVLRRALVWAPHGTIIDISTAPERWTNALSYSLSSESLESLSADDALVIECLLHVNQGAVGIGVVAADGTTFVSRERTVLAGDTPVAARIWVAEPQDGCLLLFRNVSQDGAPTHFKLLALSAFSQPGRKRFPASWSSANTTSIPLPELCEALNWAREVWDLPCPERRTMPATGAIEIVDVDALVSVFGGNNRLVLPTESQEKSLSAWKMETDDAPILECLWRAQSPNRHLEFGTWEGFGASLVARATDAEIWTINLPEGETGGDGVPLYSFTDAGSFIGRLYREAGFATRVHQVLCDSKNLDISLLGREPFDSVLIDGGHTPDVVRIDTENALRVLRPGGLCIWHDFCPDPETLSKNLAPLGVVQAVVENLEAWKAAFERFFWIRKSWILVGLGRKR